MNKHLLHGMILAPVTPSDASGAIAADLIKPMVDFSLERGVEGFFALGSTGNFPLLSLEQRKTCAEAFAKAVDGRAPLCIHIGSTSEESTLELARHAGGLGVDAVAAVPPFYFNYDAEALTGYFSRIAAVNPQLPFYIYNIPMFAKNDITPVLLRRLCEAIPNLRGVKDTTQDFTRYLDYLDVTSPDFDVLMGSDAMCVAAMSAGGAGGICAMAAHNPELMVDIFTAWRKGDMDRAQHLQRIAANIRLMLQKLPFYSSRVHIMRLRNILNVYPLPPLRPLNAAEETLLLSTMQGLEERFEYSLLHRV